ncbi:dual specificity protein phosphatase 23-like [Anticarsia gemmatalis]|uniref:dual specificity protein phosphatase 23-like n=1 Tax=Anticarsia gemmatalis TaxID=129554 RepID=UPI003F7651A8
MSTVPNRPNVKLARLWYKYREEPKERQEKEEKPEKPVVVEKKEYESYPPYNFSWFIPNKIAAMGCPQSVANLNYLVDVGVNHLITLSPERIPPILDCELKLKWTEIRVKEFGVPTLKQILKFIEICERADIRGEVVGVHCRHGRGRTGTMLACYLVHLKNMAPERAVLTVRVQRPGSCETYEQEKAVCHYHDCVRGTVEKPDYRLVEDKVYFDFSMKYMYDDDIVRRKETEEETEQEDNLKIVKLGDHSEEKRVKIKIPKKKSNAMIINHKIYF